MGADHWRKCPTNISRNTTSKEAEVEDKEDKGVVELKLTKQDQVKVAGLVAALSLIFGWQLRSSLRLWRRRRPNEKHHAKVGGLKFTLKVRTPRRRILDRS